MILDHGRDVLDLATALRAAADVPPRQRPALADALFARGLYLLHRNDQLLEDGRTLVRDEG